MSLPLFGPLLVPLGVLGAGCVGDPPKDDSAPVDDTAPDDTGTAPDPATVALHGACATEDDYGGIAVTADPSDPSVYGSVADGVVPGLVLEEIAQEGDCALWGRNYPYCEPSCAPGTWSDFDGNCVPYPANQDLGTIDIWGLATTVQMEPVFPGNTYYDTELAVPPYVAGGLLTLDMPGGVYGPITLYGVGVEALVTPGTTWVLDAGAPLTLSWTAPAGPVIRSEIAVQISIDQHGVSPSSLRCVFVDDGEGTVPGSITAALVEVGVTGFPTASIERRTADLAAAGAGCLDFTVSAPGTAAIDVVGHTPCVSDKECPEGQDCNEELQTCE